MTAMTGKRELTDRFVKTVKPAEKRIRYWDTRRKGLALVIEPSGHKSWKVAYRFAGKLEWFNLGGADKVGLATAREATGKTLAKVTLGANPQSERRASKTRAKADTTFEAVCDRFLAEYAKLRQKAWEQGAALRKRYVFPKLGKRPIGEIKRADIRAIVNELTTVLGVPILANQTLAAISAVFSWAVKQEIIEHNPARGIERNKTSSRERVLSETELPLFWRAFGDLWTAGNVLRVILLCGARPGEIRHMRGRDIELGEFTLRDNSGRPYRARGGWWTQPGEPDGEWPGVKNKTTHRVWLSEPVVAIIQKHMDGPGFVFRGKRGPAISGEWLRGVMARACDIAGVPKANRATPHDLRRTFSTTITSLGYGRDALNRVTNHKEGGIADVYDRHRYEYEACVVQRAVADRIMALVEGRGPDNVVELNQARS